MVWQVMYSLIQIIADSVKQFFGLLNLLYFPETHTQKIKSEFHLQKTFLFTNINASPVNKY